MSARLFQRSGYLFRSLTGWDPRRSLPVPLAGYLTRRLPAMSRWPVWPDSRWNLLSGKEADYRFPRWLSAPPQEHPGTIRRAVSEGRGDIGSRPSQASGDPSGWRHNAGFGSSLDIRRRLMPYPAGSLSLKAASSPPSDSSHCHPPPEYGHPALQSSACRLSRPGTLPGRSA